MAKGQKRSSREAKKDRKIDHSTHKPPRYLESAELSAPKVTVPKKRGKT